MDAEIQMLKMRVELLEKETKGIKLDVEKIISQLAAMKYTLIGVIVAESPQALEALRNLLAL